MTQPTEATTEPDSEGAAWVGWVQIGAILIVILLAVSLTFMLSGSGGSASTEAPGRPATPVSVITPQAADHAISVTITGSVAAPALVSLSPQVGGRVVAVSDAARAGGAFSAGEVLFAIDPRDYEVAVSRAQANLADARSALDQLEAEAAINRAEWERQYPGREISPLAAREPQLEAARARVQAAAADLAQARLNLERTEISYPFDGRVIDSRVELGQLAAAGQSYGTVYDAASLEILAPIAPADLARLDGALGRAAEVRFENTANPIAARVVREGAALDERTRFIDLHLEPETHTGLQPGRFAEVRLNGPVLEEAMILPAAAAPGLDQVRVVRNGVIETLEIEVLDRPRGQLVTRPFDFGQGVIISPLPEGAVGRPAAIVDRAGIAQ